jgi:ketosteroid isomerase-like protein
MSEHANTEEIRIKALLEAWANAVRRHDVPAILARHEPDMVMFDLPPPLQCKGIEAYVRTGLEPALPLSISASLPTACQPRSR